MKDYYDILQVSHAASPGEIKAAYRRLVVMYHPDKNKSPEAEHLIKEINEAYDVLGDAEKKKLYDQQFQQSISSVFGESEPRAPAHRDPRYRRRKPPHYTPAERGPTTYDLMKRYLPQMLWICRIGFVFMLLLAIDFFLPYQSDVEGIRDIYSIRGERNAYVIVTEYGRRIKIHDHGSYPFLNASSIKITRTRIFSTHMYVSDASVKNVVRLGYIYTKNFLIFPVILFLTSLFGILFRKGVEFSFNLTIVSAVLLIINLVLIL